MPFLLHIDTALEKASIMLSRNGQRIAIAENSSQKDHASWLHPSILDLSKNNEFSLDDLDAIAVTIGPGSYTGLRVGLATAKGLCFALNKPLIAINTLDLMASGAVSVQTELICPMIDARRMEVYTAIYDKDLQYLLKPTSIILDPSSFEKKLAAHTISFFGNGSGKFSSICKNYNASFPDITTNMDNMITMAEKSMENNVFADLQTIEPLYIKNFNSGEKEPPVKS